MAQQDLTQWLTPDEMARCITALSARRRADRLVGRVAVKRLLLEAFDVAPAAYEIGTDGLAPILTGWPQQTVVISLSHSAGLGAASWAWAGAEGSVGVDAQHIRPAHPGLAARILTPLERAQAAQMPGETGLLLLWALKEAAIKARRQTWGRALREIAVCLDTPAEEHGAARITIFGEPDINAWYSRQGDWWVARAVVPTPQPLRDPAERP